jgi:hypothetical protein
MTAVGTKRRIAATQRFGRFRSEANRRRVGCLRDLEVIDASNVLDIPDVDAEREVRFRLHDAESFRSPNASSAATMLCAVSITLG